MKPWLSIWLNNLEMEGTCEFTTVTDSWKIFRCQICCSIYAIVSKKDIQNANFWTREYSKGNFINKCKKIYYPNTTANHVRCAWCIRLHDVHLVTPLRCRHDCCTSTTHQVTLHGKHLVILMWLLLGYSVVVT